MKRPFHVTVTAALLVLVGALQVLIGSVALAKRNDAEFLSDADTTSSQATALGIVLLVVGVLSVVLGGALARGSRVARGLVGIILLGQVATGVYTVVQLDSSHRSSGIGMIVGSLIGLYMLFGTEQSRRFFAS